MAKRRDYTNLIHNTNNWEKTFNKISIGLILALRLNVSLYLCLFQKRSYDSSEI
jgi:hypothetical protein